jgi:hypothetical protein
MSVPITGAEISSRPSGGVSFPTTDWGMITRFFATDPEQARASL